MLSSRITNPAAPCRQNYRYCSSFKITLLASHQRHNSSPFSHKEITVRGVGGKGALEERETSISVLKQRSFSKKYFVALIRGYRELNNLSSQRCSGSLLSGDFPC